MEKISKSKSTFNHPNMGLGLSISRKIVVPGNRKFPGIPGNFKLIFGDFLCTLIPIIFREFPGNLTALMDTHGWVETQEIQISSFAILRFCGFAIFFYFCDRRPRIKIAKSKSIFIILMKCTLCMQSFIRFV